MVSGDDRARSAVGRWREARFRVQGRGVVWLSQPLTSNPQLSTFPPGCDRRGQTRGQPLGNRGACGTAKKD